MWLLFSLLGRSHRYARGSCAAPPLFTTLTLSNRQIFIMTFVNFSIGRHVTRYWTCVRHHRYPLPTPRRRSALRREIAAVAQSTAVQHRTTGRDKSKGLCMDFSLYIKGLEQAFRHYPTKLSFLIAWSPIPTSLTFTLVGHGTAVGLRFVACPPQPLNLTMVFREFIHGNFLANIAIFVPPVIIGARVRDTTISHW